MKLEVGCLDFDLPFAQPFERDYFTGFLSLDLSYSLPSVVFHHYGFLWNMRCCAIAGVVNTDMEWYE